MDLNAFIKGNALQTQICETIISERFVDENNIPIKWKIKAINGSKDQEIKELANGDAGTYIAKLAAECVVFPNLNSAELQNSYEVMGNDKVLKEMLTCGEFNRLIKVVRSINGFDISDETLKDTAKK